MWLTVTAWVASLLVFASFFMKTMVPLRLAAIASNVAFMSYALLGLAYGIFGHVYPILVLHASLLPLNVLRLRELRKLLDAVGKADDEEAIRALVPYMTTQSRASSDVLFRRGDPADELYVVEEGRIAFPELDKRVAEGAVFGEVGLFVPESARSVTAVCESDCRLATIGKERALELVHQDPRFAMFLLRLVSGYAVDSAAGRPDDGASERVRS